MNILYTNFHKAFGGGHTTYILNLLRNPAHRLFVACPEGSRLYEHLAQSGFPGLFALEFPGGLRSPRAILRNARALARIVGEQAIDIVHTNGSADNRLALYASCLGRTRCKVVFTKHNTYPVRGLFSRLRLRLFNDAVILVGPHVAEAARMGASPRFFVVEHGVDLDHWKRSETPREPGPVLRLVSHSGTSPHKGWKDMLEAVARLAPEEQARLSLTVLGKDVHEQDITACLFPGYQEDPRPWLEAADVGFVLSHHEASSYAAREMMAMALPVILSDFAGHEPAHDPACGWVAGVKNPESVRNVLREILALSPERLLEMKMAARAKAERDFSLERCIRDTNAVYERVMGTSRRD